MRITEHLHHHLHHVITSIEVKQQQDDDDVGYRNAPAAATAGAGIEAEGGAAEWGGNEDLNENVAVFRVV